MHQVIIVALVVLLYQLIVMVMFIVMYNYNYQLLMVQLL